MTTTTAPQRPGRFDWRQLAPAEVLDTHVVLTPLQTAYVLGLTFRKGRTAGEPDRRQVLELVAAGRLRPIDPSQPVARWTFSSESVRRYIANPSEVAA